MDTTEGSIDGEDREYDDWHDCYCDETRLVFYKGREYYCDVDRLDEFTWVEELDEYHHNEDVSYCQECESYFLNEDGSYSGIMEDYYCCDECKKSAEETFKQENWYFSDYDEEYYEKEEEVTAYQEWNCIQNTYLTKTISSETLKRLLENDEFYLIGGEAYDKIDEETGMPYEYELEELAV